MICSTSADSTSENTPPGAPYLDSTLALASSARRHTFTQFISCDGDSLAAEPC